MRLFNSAASRPERSGAHRDAQIAGRQSQGVIDAVAHDGDPVSLGANLAHAIHPRFGQAIPQHLTATEFARHAVGHAFAVATHHRQPASAAVVQGRKRFLRLGSVLVLQADPADAPALVRDENEAPALGLRMMLAPSARAIVLVMRFMQEFSVGGDPDRDASLLGPRLGPGRPRGGAVPSVRLAAINPLKGAAEWTQLRFDPRYQPEGRAALLPPGVAANRAIKTHLGKGLVNGRCATGAHSVPSTASAYRGWSGVPAACRCGEWIPPIGANSSFMGGLDRVPVALTRSPRRRVHAVAWCRRAARGNLQF